MSETRACFDFFGAENLDGARAPRSLSMPQPWLSRTFCFPSFYCLDFFVFFVLGHSCVLQVLTPSHMQTDATTPNNVGTVVSQQCRFHLHAAESLISFKLKSQQHATTGNRVCKRVNIQPMLRPFARGFILLTTRNAKQEIKNKKISHSISTEVSQLFKGCYILRQKLVTFRVKKLLLFAALR